MSFQVGELVQLMSGGPQMTVEGKSMSGNIICSWFVGDVPKRESFPAGALKKVG